VFNEFWALVDASPVITELVKPGNKIRLSNPPNDNTNRDPVKVSVQEADLPELILSSEGSVESNITASSCSTLCRRQYSWLLSTGDFRISLHLLPVQFALFAVMTKAPERLFSLQWHGAQFVRKFQYGALSEGLSNPQLNRGIRGWSSMWKCTIDMYFVTDELRLYSEGN
jgi:hypothetical protein